MSWHILNNKSQKCLGIDLLDHLYITILDKEKDSKTACVSANV